MKGIPPCAVGKESSHEHREALQRRVAGGDQEGRPHAACGRSVDSSQQHERSGVAAHPFLQRYRRGYQEAAQPATQAEITVREPTHYHQLENDDGYQKH